jgi:uncharacterized membrane protein YccC
MATATTNAPAPPAAPIANQHEGSLRALWRVVTRFDSSKLSPYMALRNSVGVLLPVIIGYAVGMPRGGLAVASGALNVMYSDGSDPYLQRSRRMLTSSFICAVAVFLGALSASHNGVAVVMTAIWAFAAGLFAALGTTAADLGVISLVTLLIYAAQPLTPHQAVISGFLALGGGFLQTFLSVALWPVQRYNPERRALGNFFLELARSAEQPLSATSAPPASLQSTQAQESLSGLSRDTTLEGVRYRSLLNQAERIRLSLLILSRLRLRMDRESHVHAGVEILDRYLEKTGEILQAIGDSLLSGKPSSPMQESLAAIDALTMRMRSVASEMGPSFLAAVSQDALFQMDAQYGQLRAVLELSRNTTRVGQAEFAKQEAQQPWWLRFSGPLATLRANLNLQSSFFRHAVRLSVMVSIGELLGRGFYWPRSYWLPMTIVLVLKPDFTTTFSRGVLRIGGTIIGLLLATALFHFLPFGPTLEIILIFVFTFLLRWFGPANYGVFAIAISALVVFLIAITGISPRDVILARGLNTAGGGSLALLAYWLWPTWERAAISERFAQMLDAYRSYFHVLFGPYPQPQTITALEITRVRMNARLARSNLEAALDRLAAEPGTSAEQMSRLNAMLASSHRFVHAVMALEAGWWQTPAVKPRPEFLIFAGEVEKTLSLLAKMLQGSHVSHKEFPDLRQSHNRLIQAGEPLTARYALSNIEADRITNSLNTLREQIVKWTHSSQTSQPPAQSQA